MLRTRLLPIIAISIVLLAPAQARLSEVSPLFDLGAPQSGAFPSDWFTVADGRQNTGLRVNLPRPDCQHRPSDCQDIDVINTLDGFNVQPRLSIPFSGGIDVRSVTSDSVFLVKLICPHDNQDCDEGATPARVGINQVVWDTLTNTLHVE